jgi:hypothetical protein
VNIDYGHELFGLKLVAVRAPSASGPGAHGRSQRECGSRPHRSWWDTVPRRFAVVLISLTIMAIAGWCAAPALAGWRSSTTTTASIAYNQGIAVDQTRSNFFFDGVSSTTNSGLYRTDAKLAQTAANTAVIPATKEGYNHAGDLSFDMVGRRVLLRCATGSVSTAVCRRRTTGRGRTRAGVGERRCGA